MLVLAAQAHQVALQGFRLRLEGNSFTPVKFTVKLLILATFFWQKSLKNASAKLKHAKLIISQAGEMRQHI